MRTIMIILWLTLAGVLSGCRCGKDDAPQGHYRVRVEPVVESQDLVIYRVAVTFAGKRTVEVREPGGAETMTIEPAPAEKQAGCEVLLVADGVDVGGNRCLKWLHQIRSRNGSAGGPSICPLAGRGVA